MLNVISFTFNAFQEHTYLLTDEQARCWIVDPGIYGEEEQNELSDYIDSNHLKPQAILNTHAHLDHVLGVDYLKIKYQIPFGIHRQELPVLDMAKMSASLYGFDLKESPKPDFFIPDGQPLKLGNEICEVYLTPGHSPGSISFYHAPGNWVVCGDVLFAESIGRTDLPGGNMQVLLHSIRTHLFTLPGETIVLSGHGDPTTIAHEIQYNPFLR